MTELSVVGKSIPRIDGREKVTGETRFSADLQLPGMLHGKLLRSSHPHARIVAIDTSRAEQLPGVKAVVTGRDAPPGKFGFYNRGRDVFARETVRYIGEPLAAIAAESTDLAEEAAALIKIRFEELPAVFDPEEALKPNPTVIVHSDLSEYGGHSVPGAGWGVLFDPELPNVYFHRKIRHGDTARGFAGVDLTLENRFAAPRMHHGVLEPHNCVVRPEADGGLTIWATTTRLYVPRAELSSLLKIPISKIRVIAPLIGGSFGARNHQELLLAQAAMLAIKSGRPVKVTLSREECFLDNMTREPTVIYIKDGVKKDGTLVAREMKIIINGGAHGSSALPCTRNMPFTATGVYRVPHFSLDAYGVATNEPPIGSFAGFGNMQVSYAIESQMDMLAERLGLDQLEIRRKNLLREGEEDVCGQTIHSIGIRECLDRAAEAVEWEKPIGLERGPWRRGKGIGLGCKHSAGGVTSVASVKVHEDATIEVRHSAHDQGQGVNTVMAQLAAEAFKTSADKVKVVHTDSAVTPYEFGTVSSRSTHQTGVALLKACADARRKLFAHASARLGIPADGLDIGDGRVFVKGVPERAIRVSELFTPLGYLTSGGELVGWGVHTVVISQEDMQTGQGKRIIDGYGYGANAVEVAVNVETGEVKVLQVAGYFDMGQAINPKMCESQMEMGVGFGIGCALFEEIVIEDGKIVNPDFVDYKVPSAEDLPLMSKVKSGIAAAPDRDGPFGAKGFGEVPLAPLAAAIGNALHNAAGIRLMDIPLTREKVLKALKGR
ncbi:MAG: coxL [Dehalococcoidia bacterium]|nr:coxL [Dehalococcoidia bacterium]